MRSAFCSLLVAILICPLLSQAADEPLPPRVFSHPDRIRYDSQCFTIEGKDTFIFSGAFHYFRCPRELWNDRFDKIKAAGFNTVETYAAWNAQEPAMPASVDDYSKVDLKDLDDWLTMAEAHGLYVIIRPGPYICAEWNCGGFPQWLLTRRPADYKGMWLRSDEPTFVAWSKHWYHAVDQVLVKHQLTHRAPGSYGIILYQLENEYGGVQPDAMEVRYLHALGQQTIDDGIDVPLFTCWTAVVRGSTDPVLRQVYDSCNFYPRFDVDKIATEIAKLDTQQPDAPRQTTELQGGWFAAPGKADSLSQSWTGVIDSLSPAQIQNLTLYAIEKGDRVTNYYMLFGGTNFGDMAPMNITTSYDYSAPIREIGGVGEKYQRVAAIGAMLKEHGERLARATPLTCSAETGYSDVTVTARRASQGGVYLFFRTNQHGVARKGTAKVSLMLNFWNGWGPASEPVVAAGEMIGVGFSEDISYELEPFGSKIFYLPENHETRHGVEIPVPGAQMVGRWLPEPITQIKRPTDGLPTPIKLTETLTKADRGPVQWQPLKDNQTLEQMGIYDRRFVFYRTHVNGGEAATPPVPPMISIVGPTRDNLLTFDNGQMDSALAKPGGHQTTKMIPNDNTLEILYENIGQPNGKIGMEEMSGITKIEKLMTAGTVSDWAIKKITPPATGKLQPDRLKEVAEDIDEGFWEHVKIESDADANQLNVNEYAVFRGSLELNAPQINAGDLNIQLSRMGDAGWVFVNGTKIGEGHQRDGSFTFLAKSLHEGTNTIAVVIQNTTARGGLGMVKLLTPDATSPASAIEIGTESTGFAQQWWKTDLDETGWTAEKIGGGVHVGLTGISVDIPVASSPQGLKWSRFKFDLPEPTKGIWVPWVARLTTTGNGFLYLNGHPLGRYWQVGPQHDFFLPECWMNFGPGKTNVLTMCLRSVDGKPVSISSAEIVPVNEVAEFRP